MALPLATTVSLVFFVFFPDLCLLPLRGGVVGSHLPFSNAALHATPSPPRATVLAPPPHSLPLFAVGCRLI